MRKKSHISLAHYLMNSEGMESIQHHKGVKSLADEKVKNASLVLKLTENPTKLLSAILIGNNIVNIHVKRMTK